ncbi:MAG: alpha-E domain-containing protein [Burkholderiales bacterium]
MLSRVADSVYWLGRYLERAENVARFIDVNLNLMLDLGSAQKQQWEPLVQVTDDAELFRKTYGAPTRENVIHFLTFDAAYSNSILSCLAAARDNARSVREVISSEMWEQVNSFYHMVRGARGAGATSQFYSEVKMASHRFAGVSGATMSHNEAWQFLRLGRMLERADKTSRILDVKYFILLPEVSEVGSAFDSIQWTALLRSASANEMYRKRYRQVSPGRIVQFLILDPEFPRAVRYCVTEAQAALHAISGTAIGAFSNVAEQRIGRLAAELNYARIEEIISAGLHEYVDNLQLKLNRVGDAVFETFCSLPPLPAAREYSAQS